MISKRACISSAVVLFAVCTAAGVLLAQHGSSDSQPASKTTVTEPAPQSNVQPLPQVQQLAQARVSRFAAVDVVIDSKDQPLAAYQISFAASAGDVSIVSIEGGKHAAFAEPPYYDPKAIQNERAILAGFSTRGAGDLPKGRTRVATVHVEIRGNVEPQFEWKVQVAATVKGESIPVEVSVHTQKGAL